jgi:hypothetical protein
VAVGLGCGPLPREDDEGLGVEVGRCEGWVLVGFGVGPPVEMVGGGAGGVGVACGVGVAGTAEGEGTGVGVGRGGAGTAGTAVGAGVDAGWPAPGATLGVPPGGEAKGVATAAVAVGPCDGGRGTTTGTAVREPSCGGVVAPGAPGPSVEPSTTGRGPPLSMVRRATIAREPATTASACRAPRASRAPARDPCRVALAMAQR